jgi:hypothetical protein
MLYFSVIQDHTLRDNVAYKFSRNIVAGVGLGNGK